jgi:hypothetical protein
MSPPAGRSYTGFGQVAAVVALVGALVTAAAAPGLPPAVDARSWLAEPANLGRIKREISQYYGGHVDDTGHHHASPDSPWAGRVAAVVRAARTYLAARLAAGVRQPAIVLDIDDTAEQTYDWSADRDFGFDAAAQRQAIADAAFPPVEPTRDLATWASQRGVRVFFVTGRAEELAQSTANGLRVHGFPEPAGLFLRPTRTPRAYLPCGLTCDTVSYKAGTRAFLEAQGNTIVLNLGDQDSDLAGGHAERAVKLPNPMYTVP